MFGKPKKERQLIPSLSLIIALLALFVALGGSAYAVSTAQTNGNQIMPHTITGLQIKPGSITGYQIKNGSLMINKLNRHAQIVTVNPASPTPVTGPSGPAGKEGATGQNGLSGADGKNGEKGEQGNTGSQGSPGAAGPQGDPGTPGSPGATGPAGPQGPQGESAVKTITASTAVTNWPEGSGWATDEFTRSLVLTRNYAVPSANCGGAPTCWFYTGTLTDNGGFTTVDGNASPNTSSTETITGELTGSLTGEATFEFYASSGSPDASLVPATQEYEAGVVSTTGWAKLAFPSGVTFTNLSLTAYKWVYSLGCPEQTWTDQINPGDDGQSAGDGNITGACS